MLSLASLKARWASLFGSFVALMLGVLTLTMAGLLLTSAKPQTPQRFSAASIVVQSPDPQAAADTFLPRRPWSPTRVQSLIAELSAIPGVIAAIPDTPIHAQPMIGGKPATATEGNSWAAAALAGHTLTAGAPPARDDEVALPGHRPGERVTILTAEGPRDYTVTGTADAIYFFKPSTGVRAIGLLTDGEVDLTHVERAVDGDGMVLIGDARSALESPADARTRWIGMQVLTAMGALSGFVAIFLVASTFSFSVLQRTRELGLLRAIGATPKQLRRMMFGEATLIGLLAGACGVPLGCLSAPVLGSLLVRAGYEPPSFTVHYSLWPIALAFLTGLAVALAGVVVASRRAASVGPLAALRAADAERRPMTRLRWIFGLLAVALGALLAFATATGDTLSMPTNAMGAVMSLIVGLALLSPAIVPPLARILLAPFASSPLGLLVRQSATTSARRTAATAAPVMLAVAFTVLVTGMVQTGAHAYATRRAAQIPGTAALIPDATPGLTDAAVPLDAVSFLPTTVWHGNIPIPALGLSPTAFTTLTRPAISSAASPAAAPTASPHPTASPGAPPTASPHNAASSTASPSTAPSGGPSDGPGVGGSVEEMVVAQALAQQYGWGVGEVVALTVASGQTVEFRVAAIVDSAPAGIVMRRDSARSHDPDALTSVAYLASGDHLGPVPGAKLISAADYAAIADAEEDRLVWMFTLILVGMAGGFAIIAVANTLLMAAVSRRPELLSLTRLGATRRQLLQLAALETAFVVAVGTLLGFATSLPGLLAIRAGLSAQIGHPVALVIAWPTLGAVTCACLIGALLASLAPHATVRPRRRSGQRGR